MVATPPLRDDPNGTTTGDTDWNDLTLPRYDAEIVRYDDAPDECTIYPADTEEWDLLTTWISAAEGSYVELAAMR